jgi:hypothetical protein
MERSHIPLERVVRHERDKMALGRKAFRYPKILIHDVKRNKLTGSKSPGDEYNNKERNMSRTN